jgi:ADP-ribose pyrophosphatase YjhB (NUDIX family)
MSSTPKKRASLSPQVQGQQSDEVVHISSFAIIKKGDKILLAKRIRPEFTAGKWTIPSSIINVGEHPEEATKRIVKEQIGAEARNTKLLDIQSYGDKHWDLCFVYEVVIDGTGKISPDIELVEYFEKGKMPPEFRTDHAEVLQKLGSKS